MKGLRTAVNNTITFKNSQGNSARGVLLKLNRNTIVLEVYNPYSIVQLSEVLSELKVMRGEKVIYNGKAVVNTLLNTGLMLIVSATLVDTWRDLAELESTDSIESEIRYFIEDWNSSSHINPGYRLIVGEIRSFLSAFHRWLEQFDVREETSLTMDNMYNALFPAIQEQLTNLFIKFESETHLVPKESLTAHKAYAQSNIHPLTLRSPFVHRCFSKPLGYAGDYEMVNMMLRNPREGEGLYNQLVNTFYLETSTSIAHRNRIEILVDTLTRSAEKAASENKTLRILNIACGPAIELQRFSQNPLSKRCRFELLDFNQETLKYTERMLKNSTLVKDMSNFSFIYKSVHDLLKETRQHGDVSNENTYDLVYCAGLFDYLSDKVCSKLIRLFYRWAKPGGKVVLTNVHDNNPIKGLMEHLLEWYLVYRDEAGMAKLADDMQGKSTFVDETGLNIFLEIPKEQEA